VLNVTNNVAVRQYRVVIGWYSPVDFSRLPSAYPESAYLLTVVTRE
jgi:hypothetical protein